jgi:hypothetical protein
VHDREQTTTPTVNDGVRRYLVYGDHKIVNSAVGEPPARKPS